MFTGSAAYSAVIPPRREGMHLIGGAGSLWDGYPSAQREEWSGVDNAIAFHAIIPPHREGIDAYLQPLSNCNGYPSAQGGDTLFDIIRLSFSRLSLHAGRGFISLAERGHSGTVIPPRREGMLVRKL